MMILAQEVFMPLLRCSHVKMAAVTKSDRYFSSDEEVWETPYEPITNVFSCGWLEDGRCGYRPTSNQLHQLSPRPVPGILLPPDSKRRQFVCKKASAGGRHTLLLMINHLPEKGRFGRKTKQLMFFGLNQGYLCEEDGVWSPEEVEWDVEEEPPIDVTAGYGTCFVISKGPPLCLSPVITSVSWKCL
jgi:hypothetical protein